MTAGVRRRASRDEGPVQTIVPDHDGWAWAVIFTMASLGWLSLGVLLLLSPG